MPAKKASTNPKKSRPGKTAAPAKRASASKTETVAVNESKQTNAATAAGGAVTATTTSKVLVVNMIPRSLSHEANQDSEPSIAVNPTNPLQIVGTAFTPDPFGGDMSPIFISNDGGRTWSLNFIVPSQEVTGDITVAFSSMTNNLYAGILRFPAPANETRLSIMRTSDFMSATPMKVFVDRLMADQPFVQALTVPTPSGGKRDRVYVGVNDFADPNGQTSTIDMSLNAAIAKAKFKSIRLETRATSGQNGPQVRPTCHPDGTVYLAYYRWISQTGNWKANTLMITADVIVVRDDRGGLGSKPFRALVDEDGFAGKRVAQNVTFPFHNTGQGVPGQQRLGGDIAIAVDPTNKKRVYLAWADKQPNADYTVHVRRSDDSGETWSAVDLRTLANAINPALAINSVGKVGLLYQQLTGTGADQRWVTHFRRTLDDTGQNWDDLILATVPANTPTVAYPVGFDPYLGDYIHLMAVGKNFYGVFCANNTPDPANFPSKVNFQRKVDLATHRLLDLDGNRVEVSIDPFFFSVTE